MADASARGWGHPGVPGSSTGSRYRRDNIIRVTAGGITLYVHHLVAPLFEGFIEELVTAGYPVNVRADDWGFNHRYIRGLERQRVLSNHAWGLAIDLNAITNPMAARLVTDMPPWVRALAAKWGLSWGGAWTGSRKDPMHFEFLGTPADARRLVQKLHVLDDAGIKEKQQLMVLTAVHPEAGFTLVHPDGSVFNYADNRSVRDSRFKSGRRPTRYLGGMNAPHMAKHRSRAPGVAIVGFYYRPEKDHGGDYPYVIVYADGAYFEFPSDASLAKAA